MARDYSNMSEEAKARESAHWFGREGGNQMNLDRVKAGSIRQFMATLSLMTKKEVEDYIKNEENPMFKRRVAETFIAKQCKPKDLCAYINQVEGMPTQPISNEEPPVVNINITTNADTIDQ